MKILRGQLIDRAIFISGYFLPESDLTVRLMLRNHVNPGSPIYIIDNNTNEFNGKFELQIKYNKLLENKIIVII
jgi:hypothetical protein